jgi:hypothetical protein
MKKLILILLIINFSLLLTGCPKPPPSPDHILLQNNAKWVCDNPEMYFEVNLNDYNLVTYTGGIEAVYYSFPGMMNKDDVMTDIIADIFDKSSISFSIRIEEMLWNNLFYGGKCTLDDDVLTIEIKRSNENVWDSSIKELVFTKYELEDETGYE